MFWDGKFKLQCQAEFVGLYYAGFVNVLPIIYKIANIRMRHCFIALVMIVGLTSSFVQAQKYPFNFNWDRPSDFPSPLEAVQYAQMHALGYQELLRVSSYEDGHRTLKRIILDEEGRLLKVSYAPFNDMFIEHQNYVYDDAGRLRQVRGSGLNENTVSFAYDWGDRISLEEYSSGRGVEKPVRREYDYDREDNLILVKEFHGTYQINYVATPKSGKTATVKAIGEGEAYSWYAGDSVKWTAAGDGLRMMQPPEFKLGRMTYDKEGRLTSRLWSDLPPFPRQVVLVEKYGYDEAGRLEWHLVSTSEEVDTKEKAMEGCGARFRLEEYSYQANGLMQEIRATICEDGKNTSVSKEKFTYK